MTVGFPGLGLELLVNDTAFSVFGFAIKWYAICIASGLILGVVFALWQSKNFGVSRDAVYDIGLWGAIGAIVCARAYFVINNIDYYVDKPWEVFNTRGGGMAIYGAIIGAVVVAFFYCKRKKVDLPSMFDLGALGMLIGQAIGRWGNFFNVEAYGTATNLPWRMRIYDVYTASMAEVHPTFLYESLWNALTFVILFAYNKHKKFKGEIFLMYIASYGLGRAWIEALRVDSLPYNASYRTSQIVAIITFVVSVVAIIAIRAKKKREPIVEEVAEESAQKENAQD